ncbi:MAG: MazG family protein [Gemmatimonadales bacterium]|nr:MazG family protein [Gemmatimonadales bacterium]
MQGESGFGDVLDLVRDLRKRCDFDRALTLDTLRPYLREEVAELEDAIDHGDQAKIMGELGDLLLHCAFQVVLAEERGAFDISSVTQRLVTKMKARHPHLYAHGEKPRWERMKVEERKREAEMSGELGEKGEKGEKRGGILGRLPPSLPELERAFRYQERAASVGFDWNDVMGPLDKLEEEVREARVHPAEEIGDVLFAAVNVARKAGVHPVIALRDATAKFVRRVDALETMAAERGVELGRVELEVLDGLWDEVKKGE